MQMPETEPPGHLLRAEVDVALGRLHKDAAELARLMTIAKLLAHNLPAMNAEDLLGTAMLKVLTGERKWRRDLSAFVMLQGAMRSIAYSIRKQDNYLLAEDLGTKSVEDAEDETSSLAEGVSAESDPARTVVAESLLLAVERAVQGDEEMELLVVALADGLTGTDVARELGWDLKKYDAARKRLRRRLAELKKDGSKP